MSSRTIIILSIFLLGLVPISQLADATHVTPTFVSGNPVCSAGSAFLKVEGPNFLTTDGTLSVTLNPTFDANSNPGVPIDWTSNLPVQEVIVKGGPNANVYNYGTGETSDTDLVTPTNTNNNNLFGLSHITFCYTPPAPVCGDGIINPPSEQCEPPNTATCDSICQIIVPPTEIVGGQIIPIDSTALLLAGAQSSLSWIVPIVLAGAGFVAFKLRRN